MRLSTIILLLIRFKIGNDKKKDFKIRITHNCLFFTDLYWSHNRSRNRKRRRQAVPWLITLLLARIEPLSTLLTRAGTRKFDRDGAICIKNGTFEYFDGTNPITGKGVSYSILQRF